MRHFENFATTVSVPSGITMKTKLYPAGLKALLHISETEIASLPEEEQQIYHRVLELAMMCGGWSEPTNNNIYSKELTLREHCIF